MGGFSVLSPAGNVLLLSKPSAAPDEAIPSKVLPLSGLQLTSPPTYARSVLESTSLLQSGAEALEWVISLSQTQPMCTRGHSSPSHSRPFGGPGGGVLAKTTGSGLNGGASSSG